MGNGGVDPSCGVPSRCRAGTRLETRPRRLRSPVGPVGIWNLLRPGLSRGVGSRRRVGSRKGDGRPRTVESYGVRVSPLGSQGVGG